MRKNWLLPTLINVIEVLPFQLKHELFPEDSNQLGTKILFQTEFPKR